MDADIDRNVLKALTAQSLSDDAVIAVDQVKDVAA
jgi:hypothetical protein